MLIYFAAPLFSQAERRFNQALTEQLEAIGYQVFLPQRDGVEGDKPPYDQMPRAERRVAMFQMDATKIMESDLFLFVLDGRVPDEGACVELGIAYTHKQLLHTNRLLVGLHTDARAAFMGAKLNPMIFVPLDYIATTENQLLQALTDYQQSNSIESIQQHFT